MSDAWVTAYTGASLAASTHPQARRLAHEAWGRLTRRRPWLPGWAYNHAVPLDADSTIWALHLAEVLGVCHPRIQRAYRFLHKHIQPSGGMATYASGSPIWRHIGLPSRRMCAGWMAAHTCVTAAAANLSGFRSHIDVVRFLLAAAEHDGHWEGYWWADPEYTTGLAVQAFARKWDRSSERLAVNLQANIQTAIAAASAWLRERFDDGRISTDREAGGSAFATACALQALAKTPSAVDHQDLLDEVSSWLVRAQHEDGSWGPSARLRIPSPNVVNPAGVTAWSYRSDVDANTIKWDHNRVFTTATVVAALTALERSHP